MSSTWNWQTHLSWAPSSLQVPPNRQVESSQTLRSLFFSDRSNGRDTNKGSELNTETTGRRINEVSHTCGTSTSAAAKSRLWSHAQSRQVYEFMNNKSRRRAELQEKYGHDRDDCLSARADTWTTGECLHRGNNRWTRRAEKSALLRGKKTGGWYHH